MLGQSAGRYTQAQNDYVNAVHHLGQVRLDGAQRLADGAARRPTPRQLSVPSASSQSDCTWLTCDLAS